MSSPRSDDAAQGLVSALARETGVPVDELVQLYETRRAELESQARVKIFLPIFAIRSVRDALHRRRVAGE